MAEGQRNQPSAQESGAPASSSAAPAKTPQKHINPFDIYNSSTINQLKKNIQFYYTPNIKKRQFQFANQ